MNADYDHSWIDKYLEDDGGMSEAEAASLIEYIQEKIFQNPTQLKDKLGSTPDHEAIISEPDSTQGEE